MGRIAAPDQGIKMARVSDHKRKPGKRQECKGWTASAARRNRNFVMSIDGDRLVGIGVAFTLTVRDCPPSAKDWARCVDVLRKRLVRMGCRCDHWVTEWQERGCPHLHGMAFFDFETARSLGRFTKGVPMPQDEHQLAEMRDHLAHNIRMDIVSAWLEIAAVYAAERQAQYALPVDGISGWLQYVSKHASRGAEHYQRQRDLLPEGWKTSGRLWGKGGSWPTSETTYDSDGKSWFRLRRACRQYVRSQARTQLRNGLRYGNPHQVKMAKKSLSYRRHGGSGETIEEKRHSSEFRGISVFVPFPYNRRLIGWARGHDKGVLNVLREVKDGVRVDAG